MRAILLCFTFILSSCSTTIVREDKLFNAKLTNDVLSQFKGKKLVRMFMWRECYGQTEDGEKFISSISANNQFNNVIENTLLGSKAKLHFDQSSKNEMFNLRLLSNKERDISYIDRWINGNFKNQDYDYFINIYDYEFLSQCHGHAYEILWGMVHGLSLGLIPYVEKKATDIHIDVINNKGELVSSSSSDNSAWAWTWSPLIFSKKSEKWMGNKKGTDRIRRNALNKALMKLKPRSE